jgi:hypothetical protein
VNWDIPELWDVLLCKFPEAGASAGKPGSKARPVFVAGIGETGKKECVVKVVYGTTQKTDALFAGEFLIDPASDSADCLRAGLIRKTKFDLNRRAILPYNEEFFSCAHGMTSPLLGSLSKNLQLRAATALRRLQAL